MVIYSTSNNGTFAERGNYLCEFNKDDLNLTTKEKLEDWNFTDITYEFGFIEGRPLTDLLKTNPEYSQNGIARAIIEYDDGILLISRQELGDNGHRNNESIPYVIYYETVYAFYSKDNELVWRSASKPYGEITNTDGLIFIA